MQLLRKALISTAVGFTVGLTIITLTGQQFTAGWVSGIAAWVVWDLVT